MANPTYTKVGSRPLHREHAKLFLQSIGNAARREGWREAEAFRKWLIAASCAIRRPAFELLYFHPQRAKLIASNEVEYMQIVKECRHASATMGDLAHALKFATAALDAEQSDFLSPIFTELSAYADAGQFFTPYDLCRLMAELTVPPGRQSLDEAKERGDDHLLIAEPAVGCGAMVLATTDVLKAREIDPAREAHFVCQDVDRYCVAASYIQLSLCGISAEIIHGNSLSLEQWAWAPTVCAAMHPKRRRASVDTSATLPSPTAAAAKTTINAQSAQLSLL